MNRGLEEHRRRIIERRAELSIIGRYMLDGTRFSVQGNPFGQQKMRRVASAVALVFGDRDDDSVTLDEPLLLVTALLLRVALLLCVPLMEALLLRVALPHVDALMVALAERDSEGDAVSVLGAL